MSVVKHQKSSWRHVFAEVESPNSLQLDLHMEGSAHITLLVVLHLHTYHPLGMQYTTHNFYIKLYHISTDIEPTISEILIAYLSLWFVVKEISRRNEIIMTLMAAFLLLHHREFLPSKNTRQSISTYLVSLNRYGTKAGAISQEEVSKPFPTCLLFLSFLSLFLLFFFIPVLCPLCPSHSSSSSFCSFFLTFFFQPLCSLFVVLLPVVSHFLAALAALYPPRWLTHSLTDCFDSKAMQTLPNHTYQYKTNRYLPDWLSWPT